MRIDPLQNLKINPFVLAPMAGITDHAFRTFMRKMQAGTVVTELVSATGIEYKSERTLSLMSFEESQRPIGIQLFGEDPEVLAKAAQLVESMGADFVDLNFGCPVPKVVKKGAGSAMLKDLVTLKAVLTAVKSAVKIPVTIKIRTGWDDTQKNALDVANLAYDCGISWVAIHGRTRAQGYSGLADWEFIGQVKAKSKVPIIGNGDILSGRVANQRLKDYSLDAVMIGRGCLKNPFIFEDALSLYQQQPINTGQTRNFNEVFENLRHQVVAHCNDHITQIQLKKYASWFSTGYPGASAFRRDIFQAKSTSDVILMAHDFFSNIGTIEQGDTSEDGFLMGGHG